MAIGPWWENDEETQNRLFGDIPGVSMPGLATSGTTGQAVRGWTTTPKPQNPQGEDYIYRPYNGLLPNQGQGNQNTAFLAPQPIRAQQNPIQPSALPQNTDISREAFLSGTAANGGTIARMASTRQQGERDYTKYSRLYPDLFPQQNAGASQPQATAQGVARTQRVLSPQSQRYQDVLARARSQPDTRPAMLPIQKGPLTFLNNTPPPGYKKVQLGGMNNTQFYLRNDAQLRTTSKKTLNAKSSGTRYMDGTSTGKVRDVKTMGGSFLDQAKNGKTNTADQQLRALGQIGTATSGDATKKQITGAESSKMESAAIKSALGSAYTPEKANQVYTLASNIAQKNGISIIAAIELLKKKALEASSSNALTNTLT